MAKIDENFATSILNQDGNSEIKQEQFVIVDDNSLSSISSTDDTNNVLENYSESEIHIAHHLILQNDEVNDRDPLEQTSESTVNILQTGPSSECNTTKDILSSTSSNNIPPPVHNINSNSSNVQTMNNIKLLYKYCSICKLVFRTNLEFAHHFISNVNTHSKFMKPPFRCLICNTEFTSPYDLSYHIQSHLNSTLLTCNICNVVFPSYQYLMEHELLYHIPSYYKCPHCICTFNCKQSYLQHLNIHIALFQNRQVDVRLDSIVTSVVDKEFQALNRRSYCGPNAGAGQHANLLFATDYLNNSTATNQSGHNIGRRKTCNLELNQNNRAQNQVQPETYYNNKAMTNNNSILINILKRNVRQHSTGDGNNVREVASMGASKINLENRTKSAESINNSTIISTGELSQEKCTNMSNQASTAHVRNSVLREPFTNCAPVVGDLNSSAPVVGDLNARRDIHHQVNATTNSTVLCNILNHASVSVNQNKTPMPLLCHVCGSYRTYTYFNRHLSKHTKDKASTCEVCDMKFKSEYFLANHINSHILVYNYESEINQEDNEQFICIICKKNCSKFIDFRSHIFEHTKNTHQDFFTPEQTEHLELREEETYRCSICVEQYHAVTVTNLPIVSHGTPHYTCHLCLASFYEQAQLFSHYIRHMLTKYLHCVVCCEKFANVTQYIKHLYTHVDDLQTMFLNMRLNQHRTLLCSACFATFDNIEQLREHSISHHLTKLQMLKQYEVHLNCTAYKKDIKIIKDSKLQNLKLQNNKLTATEDLNQSPVKSLQSKISSFLIDHSSGIDKARQNNTSITSDHNHTKDITHIKIIEQSCKEVSKSDSATDKDSNVDINSDNSVSSVNYHQFKTKNCKQYICIYCNKVSGTFIDHHRHQEWHESSGYGCDLCQKSFTTKQARSFHMKNRVCSKQYICIYCSKVLDRFIDYHRHREWHENIGYGCDTCQKSFTTKQARTFHVNNLVCSKPKKVTKSVNVQFNKHQKSFAVTKQTHGLISKIKSNKLLCEWCNKTFSNITSISYHKKNLVCIKKSSQKRKVNNSAPRNINNNVRKVAYTLDEMTKDACDGDTEFTSSPHVIDDVICTPDIFTEYSTDSTREEDGGTSDGDVRTSNIADSSASPISDHAGDDANTFEPFEFEYTYEEIEVSPEVKSPICNRDDEAATANENSDIYERDPGNNCDFKKVEYLYEEIEIAVDGSADEPNEHDEIEPCIDDNKPTQGHPGDTVSVSSKRSASEKLGTSSSCGFLTSTKNVPDVKYAIVRECYVRLERLDVDEYMKRGVQNKVIGANVVDVVSNSKLTSKCSQSVNNKTRVKIAEIRNISRQQKIQDNISVDDGNKKSKSRKTKLKLNNTEELQIKKTKVNTSEYYICPFCKLICTNVNNFSAHVGIRGINEEQCISNYIIKHSGAFTCTTCNVTMPNLLTYNSHICSHQMNAQYGCAQCDAKFIYVCMLNRHHLFTKHLNKQYWCGSCNIEFYNVFSMSEHENTCH